MQVSILSVLPNTITDREALMRPKAAWHRRWGPNMLWERVLTGAVSAASLCSLVFPQSTGILSYGWEVVGWCLSLLFLPPRRGGAPAVLPVAIFGNSFFRLPPGSSRVFAEHILCDGALFSILGMCRN